MRRFRIFSQDSYVSLDMHEKYALMVSKGPKWAERKGDLSAVDPDMMRDRERLKKFVFEGLLSVKEFRTEDQDPLGEELAAFVASVRDGEPIRVPGEDGRRALAAAIQVQDALGNRRW